MGNNVHMTEAREYPSSERHSYPDLIVVKGEGFETAQADTELMAGHAREFIARSVGLDPSELDWIRSQDATAIVALFDTVIEKFTDQAALHEREIMRLESYMRDALSDEEISEQVAERFGVSMLAEDVRLEREDIEELVHEAVQKLGAGDLVHEAIGALRQEAQAAVTAEVIPIVEAFSEADDEAEPVLMVASRVGVTRPTARPARASRRRSTLQTVTESADSDSELVAEPGFDDTEDTEGVEQLGTPERDPLGQYLYEIGKEPLLTAEEEVELARTIEAGVFTEQILNARRNPEEKISDLPDDVIEKYAHVPDDELAEMVRIGQEAYRRFIRANLRLVVSVARKHRGGDLPFLDKVQEGNLGLVRAVEKFDYTKGFKFSTYATWWIRQAITRGVADSARMIRLPVHTVELVNKISKVRRTITNNLGRDPTDEEVAKEVGIDIKKLQEIDEVSRGTLSLDAPVGEDNETRFGDFIAAQQDEGSNSNVADRLLMKQLHEIVRGTLDDREYDVCVRRMGLNGQEPDTLEGISKKWGVTRERIRQIERKAKQKLKNSLSELPDIQDMLDIFGISV